MIDFDFNDDLSKSVPAMTPAEIRKQAHVANGGEATFPCPKCGGSGMTPWGRCFKCNGNGSVSRGVIAAAKGKITKANNIAQWKADNADVIEYLDKRSGRWPFAASMLEKIEEWGKLTENQIAAVRKVMDQDALRAAERTATIKREAPSVDVSAIQKLFDTATENDVKRPIFRTVDVTISKAPMTGRNPGALYIKSTDSGEYLGKIAEGRFFGQPAALETLRAVAENPGAEAIKYSRKFSACGICGTQTIDPVSIRSAVGPVCAKKWGLEHLRDAAREELAGE